MAITFTDNLSISDIDKVTSFMDNITAIDAKSALVNNMENMDDKINELNKRLDTITEVTYHSVGETKEMMDGTIYEVTSKGWKKIRGKD